MKMRKMIRMMKVDREGRRLEESWRDEEKRINREEEARRCMGNKVVELIGGLR